MHVPPEIFREYDIRGIYGPGLTEEAAYFVGRALAAEVSHRKPGARTGAAVGHDNRPSSPSLADALIRGLREGGVHIADVGEVPTPVLYFADRELGTDLAVQITGSHNPPEYNGIKMTVGHFPFFGAAIQTLRRRINKADFGDPPAGRGALTSTSVLSRYVEKFGSRARTPAPVRMVLDAGNGAGSVVAVEALEAAGIEVEGLFCESDGTFPNHHPDPTVDENLLHLADRVKERDWALGTALDGDADRLGAVTGSGTPVRADRLMALFARQTLARHPGATIVFDVKCSSALADTITAGGGTPEMWKTGHALIRTRMNELGAPLAGEMSGHIFFADWYGFDDGIYAAARLAGLVAASGRTLEELVAELPHRPSTPELRIPCPEGAGPEIVRDMTAFFSSNYDVADIDGARIEFGGGWGLIRSSNTQPVVVARIEADSDARLGEIAAEMDDRLSRWGVSIGQVMASVT